MTQPVTRSCSSPTLALLPITLGFYNSFEDGADLSTIADNIAAVVHVDTNGAFDFGDGRTLNDAFNSCAYNYDQCQKF